MKFIVTFALFVAIAMAASVNANENKDVMHGPGKNMTHTQHGRPQEGSAVNARFVRQAPQKEDHGKSGAHGPKNATHGQSQNHHGPANARFVRQATQKEEHGKGGSHGHKNATHGQSKNHHGPANARFVRQAPQQEEHGKSGAHGPKNVTHGQGQSHRGNHGPQKN